MSIWSDNSDELEELSTECLPEPYRSEVKEGQMLFSDVPDELKFDAMDKGLEHFIDKQAMQAEGRIDDQS